MHENIYKQDLVLEEVRIVRSTCPFSYTLYNKDFEYDKKCANCEFVKMGYSTNNVWEHFCTWKEYKTKLVEEKTDYDEDDGSGGMPSDTYIKGISCYSCSEKIIHTSGMSGMNHGDTLRCKRCGLRHTYLKWENKNYIFAIPVNHPRLKSVGMIREEHGQLVD